MYLWLCHENKRYDREGLNRCEGARRAKRRQSWTILSIVVLPALFPLGTRAQMNEEEIREAIEFFVGSTEKCIYRYGAPSYKCTARVTYDTSTLCRLIASSRYGQREEGWTQETVTIDLKDLELDRSKILLDRPFWASRDIKEVRIYTRSKREAIQRVYRRTDGTTEDSAVDSFKFLLRDQDRERSLEALFFAIESCGGRKGW